MDPRPITFSNLQEPPVSGEIPVLPDPSDTSTEAHDTSFEESSSEKKWGLSVAVGMDSSLLWRGFRWTKRPLVVGAISGNYGPAFAELYSSHLMAPQIDGAAFVGEPVEFDIIAGVGLSKESPYGTVSVTPFTSLYHYYGSWGTGTTLESAVAVDWAFNDHFTLSTEQDLGLVNETGTYYGQLQATAQASFFQDSLTTSLSSTLGWANQKHNQVFGNWDGQGLNHWTQEMGLSVTLSDHLELGARLGLTWEAQDIFEDGDRLAPNAGLSFTASL